MKNKFSMILEVASPILLMLGTLGLFFDNTIFAGYLLFAIGCIVGLISVAVSNTFDSSERFHLLTSIVGLIALGLFVMNGLLERIVVAVLVLFVVDFLVVLVDLRRGATYVPKEEKVYKEYNEEKLINELENIKDEFSHIQVFEEGSPEDIDELSLKDEAEHVAQEFKSAVVVEDPKEGRFFYKASGKMFHVKGCTVLQRIPKKELNSSNSRTELLAKGYKSCKVCNS